MAYVGPTFAYHGTIPPWASQLDPNDTLPAQLAQLVSGFVPAAGVSQATAAEIAALVAAGAHDGAGGSGSRGKGKRAADEC
mmetsp:Transcript_32777/g.74890  ORF Transcript_32777/g.74890 Transcript_32777/m.74890 type:complete len:81 (+) Transcript_32777:179-421(+)